MRNKRELRKAADDFLDEWLEDFDNFVLLDEPSALRRCDICAEKEKEVFRIIKTEKKSRKLRAMDLFAGK